MDFKKIEKKWQDKWEKNKVFEVKEDSKKKKYYCCEMFPYPSGSGLHMGHAFNYTIGDIYSRFKRMNGFNVLYPMGYDSFGLPAENAAIKAKSHPKIFTENAIKNFIKQQKALGLSYDWSRILSTCNPDYYVWNQYFFLKFMEKGLVYRKKAPVNWCPKCETVLANEQVHNGKCWRHTETHVEIKQLEQWFFKITKYADELLEDLDKIHWPERIKAMQRNWIGKSYGTEINFKINNENWPIFTTRPDTIYGVSFMVVSAQHARLNELVTKEHKKEVGDFLKKIKSTSEKDIEELEKEGAFTGSYTINPLTNEKIPVYTGNFVVAEYGSGMVMAVPAHDQRDFEFAKKYNIPIKVVINPLNSPLKAEKMTKAFTEEGELVNSKEFNSMNSKKAIDEITKFLEKKKIVKNAINYKIRDWLISRQRYWGTPIPIIYCDKCGIVPVPKKDLPVLLPEKVDFKSTGNPISTNKDFVNVKCPKCKENAKRETDTMGGFVDSSWYFLRYCDNKNKNQPFDKEKVDYWMPVDQYVGGAEHAVMHLMYARFFIKVLKDMGLVKFDEPFSKLFNQGIVYKDGAKMSKSYGNVVLQTDISEKFGIDTARLFLMFVASPDKQMEWSDTGVEGAYRIINKLIKLSDNLTKEKNELFNSKINSAIKIITENLEKFEYSKVIVTLINIIDCSNEGISKENYEILLKLISLFCPHIAEELWEKIGNKPFISLAQWPIADESKIKPELEEQEKIFEKTISDIVNILSIIKQKQNKEPSSIFLYVIPKEINDYNPEILSKKLNKQVKVFAVNDKSKHDPENKAQKAKPGKPGIYVE